MAIGKRLIITFVAGFLAASLLFALPLVTIRDRVAQLEEENVELAQQVNRSAGEQLVRAGTLLGEADITDPTATETIRAGAHVRAADALLNQTATPNLTHRALEGTAKALSGLSSASQCGLITPASPPTRAYAVLAGSLEAQGEALIAGERVKPAQVIGVASTLWDGLGSWLERYMAPANATLSLGSTTHVDVRLDGAVPLDRCRGSFSVEVCLVEDDEPATCRTTNGTDAAFEALGPDTLRAPAPTPTNSTEAVQVTLSDARGPWSGQRSCTMAAEDGASCPDG